MGPHGKPKTTDENYALFAMYGDGDKSTFKVLQASWMEAGQKAVNELVKISLDVRWVP
jgi:hypothetical protein